VEEDKLLFTCDYPAYTYNDEGKWYKLATIIFRLLRLLDTGGEMNTLYAHVIRGEHLNINSSVIKNS
jgi:hypothetical protein